ncbi:hypothetical protein TBLA_0E00170 [Henningerozyma blattae CBS 6284]|uniref:Brl1/Brr6 domain-containing protein n=1 Tax=Henningerozyma blattae (strain ATCC 34711 / CBS 6284 / DSM 70876 / NBRC 10599 / NRRL Y-10934 / UCD 77-7) TaxID=1071380 RepID=I2H3X8_HENB6|nr:hypothetical protein TBLA_0E00170 [Tetrapisispora blattae CBS 6284]CCH61080.1 hypothetical protein TBLA_0E00170 [Tetrapisispora blattae CBS 6284]
MEPSTLIQRNYGKNIVKQNTRDTLKEDNYDEKSETATQNSNYSPIQKGIKPSLVSEWIHLAFNTFFMVILVFFLGKLVFLIKKDVDNKLLQVLDQQKDYFENCKENYNLNDCGSNNVVPALQSVCMDWARCIAKSNSPDYNHRHLSSKLWAETVAEMINAFVDPISIRSLIFILMTVGTIITVSNLAFGSYRVYYYNSKA